MNISRNKENFIIMTAIYNELVDFNYGEKQVSRDSIELVCGLSETEIDEISPYIINSVNLALNNYGEAVKAYMPHLVNWTWNRLPLLTQAILLMSYIHFYKVEKVDRKIVINVAVELAKSYIDDKQAKFINAILEKTIK